ncbi:MAG: hypothetical protein ACN6OP_10205 [Pseudomonadales bacterium]
MTYTKKDWVHVTPKIEYEGELKTVPTPCAPAEGTRFRFIGQQGSHKLPCYNMVAENFMRIVEMRKLTKIEALLYWWDYEPAHTPGASPGWPQRMELAIIIDHRVPLTYRTPCPGLWCGEGIMAPPVDLYWDMVVEANTKRLP